MKDKSTKCEEKYTIAEMLSDVSRILHNVVSTLEKETWLFLEKSPRTMNT